MGNAASLGWGAAGGDSWKERGWEDGLGACSLTVPSRASRRTASPVPGKCGAGLWKGGVKGEEVDRWPEPAEAWRLGGRVRSARSQPPFSLCCGRSQIPARRAIHSPMLTGVTHVSSQGPPGAPLASRSLHGCRSLSDCPWQGRRRAQRRTRDTRPWERSAEVSWGPLLRTWPQLAALGGHLGPGGSSLAEVKGQGWQSGHPRGPRPRGGVQLEGPPGRVEHCG